MVFYTKALRPLTPKRAALAMLLAANAFAAWADNRLHIEDFKIQSGGEYEVSVLMENDSDVAGIQTEVTLPPGMSIVRITDEKGKSVRFLLNPYRSNGHSLPDPVGEGPKYTILVTANLDMNPLRGKEGELFRFRVKAGEAMADEAEITLSNQKFSTVSATKVPLADEVARVTKVNPGDMPQAGVLTAGETAFSINPFSETKTVALSLATDFSVRAMEANVKLPKGMTVEGCSTTERTDGFDKYLGLTDAENNVYKLLVHSSDPLAVFWKEEGLVFTFDVRATNELAEDSKIEISDVELTNVQAQRVPAGGLAIDVKNLNAAALKAALEAIAKAEADSAEAVQAVDGSVAGNERVAAAMGSLADAVRALRDRIGAAYDAGQLAVTPYDAEAADAADKAALLVKTVAEEKALAVQDAVLASLQEALGAAEEAVPAAVRDNEEVTAQVQAARNAVQALKDAVADAYAAGELAGFDNTALKEAAREAIASIGKTAADAVKAAAIEAVYEKLREELDRLEQALRDQKEAISAADPDVAGQFTARGNDIMNFIDQGRTNLDADHRAASLDSTSDLRPKTAGEIEDMIGQLRADADAAQADYVNAVRKAANDRKLAELETELQALQDSLDAVGIPAADELLPGVKEQLDAQKEAVQGDLDALKNTVAAAAADTLLTAESRLPANTVAADIEALKEAVRTAGTVRDSIEKLRAANYDALKERLASLKERLKEVNGAIARMAEHVQKAVGDDRRAVAALLSATEHDIDNNYAKMADRVIVDAYNDGLDRIGAVLDELEQKADSLQNAYADEVEAEENATDAARAAVAAADALSAPGAGPDNEFYKEANEKAGEAAKAVAAARQAASDLYDRVEADKASHSVLADRAVIDSLAGNAADKLAAAREAIAEAERALAAAREAQDKADRKAANDKRLAELTAELQALQDALDAVVVPAADKLLPGAKEPLDERKQALQEAIDAMKGDIDGAAADTLLTADSQLPANTVADDTEALKEAVDAALAAKEAQDKADRKAASDKRLAELLAELQDMQDALDAVEVPAADKLLPSAKELLDNRKAAIQNAVDAMVNRVKAQAIDTLLTAQSQLPDNTVAADTEALKEAVDAALAAKEAQDKADRKAANDKRLAELTAELQALQDALDAVVVPAAERLLPGVKEQLDGTKQALQEAIDAMKGDIDGAAADTLLTADSQLPANTVADDTEALKEAVAAALAAKEAQDKADRKAANDQRLAELLAELQDMQDALDAIEVPAADKLLPGAKELLDNRKAAIQNAVDAMRNHVKEQALDTLLTAQSQLPDNTVAADTEALKEAVDAALAAKEAQDKADRKAANDKRLAELTTELQALQDALDAVEVPAADKLLPGAKEPLDNRKAAIQNAIDALTNNVKTQALDTLLTAQSQLPDNTVADDIEALKEAIGAAMAAKDARDKADRKAANDKRLAELTAELQALQDALDAVVVPAADKLLPGAKEPLDERKQAVQEAIEALKDNINGAAADTLLTADSQLPANTVADDTEALKEAIGAAMAAKDAKDKADRKAANDKRLAELTAELQALQDALDAVEVPAADKLLPGAKEPLDDRKQAVQEDIDALKDAVNGAAADTLLTAGSQLPANTVADDTEALKQAVAAARAAKEAQDKADRKAASDKRLAELLAELQDMQDALDAVEVPAADKLLPGAKEPLDDRKQAVQEDIDALKDNINGAAADTLLTAGSQLPANTVADDTEALKQAVAAARAAKEAQDKADRKAASDKRLAELTAELQALQDALDAVEVPAADKLLPGAKEPLDERKQAVQEVIDALKDAVNAAAADTLLTAGSQLPANTVAGDTEALKEAIAAALAAKDAQDKADRKAASDQRLAELLAELQDMQDALDAVEVPAADKLLPGAKELLDNRKAAIQNAIDAMRNHVKEQALDTLLTAQSQLPANTVAGDTEALKEAVAAAVAAKEAAQAELDAEIAARALARQAVDDAYALTAPAVPADREGIPFYREAAAAAGAAQEAVAEARQAADSLAADVEQKAREHAVLPAMDDIREAAGRADSLIAAATEAIGTADSLIAAADRALAEELEAQDAARDILDELDGMAGALTVPEKGSGKHYEQANRLVDAAQEAADAARNAVDSLAALLDAKKDAYAVLADSSELIDVAKAALEAIREAGKAIAAADSALLEAKAAEQAAMEVAQAANEAANAMLTDELKALKKKLNSVWAGIRGDYPDVENTLQGARDDIDFDITEERYQLQKMYAETALADSATVDSLETVYRGISDDIDSLRAKAKRLHDNEAAKRRLDGELAAVQQELQDAVDFVATEYADVAADMEPEAAKVQLSIDSVRERVDSLYGEVALTEDASIDLKPIRDAIEAYLQEAKKRHLIVGIEVVTAEDVTGAQFFTLAGKRVSAPVKGQLMVVRMPDGTTRKVFVR